MSADAFPARRRGKELQDARWQGGLDTSKKEEERK